MTKLTTYDELLAAHPAEVSAALVEAERDRGVFARRDPELALIGQDLRRWPAGTTITVAFLDGSSDLHAAIAETASQISDACGIYLDFGCDPTTGEYRQWSLADTEYAADVRVSFDMDGYWSMSGTQSIDRELIPGSLGVGGAPQQRSLNLGGFAQELGAGWRRMVLRTFLQAVGFTHGDYNPHAGSGFRWTDDDGYVETRDAQGRFAVDSAGRRPGVYTYLSGLPNRWSKAMVDQVLASGADLPIPASKPDPESVMVYRFDPFLYEEDRSPYAPASEGDQLSEGDVRRLQELYPYSDRDTDRSDQAKAALVALERDFGGVADTATTALVASLAAILGRLTGDA